MKSQQVLELKFTYSFPGEKIEYGRITDGKHYKIGSSHNANMVGDKNSEQSGNRWNACTSIIKKYLNVFSSIVLIKNIKIFKIKNRNVSEMLKRLNNFQLQNRVFNSPKEICYYDVFKNYENLIEAYGNVLKYDLQKIDMNLPIRTYFVQSHIYKMLKLLKKIYLTEIASQYNSDNYFVRSNLEKFIEDIDKFSEDLFHFSYFKIILTWAPIIAAILSILLQFFILPNILWDRIINSYSILTLLQSIILVFLLYLGVAAISFTDKRRLFTFSENKSYSNFDLWKMRSDAFFGKKREETVYLKENILFQSLGMKKKSELEIDIFLFFAFIFFLLQLFNISLSAIFYLIGMILLILFAKIRNGTV